MHKIIRQINKSDKQKKFRSLQVLFRTLLLNIQSFIWRKWVGEGNRMYTPTSLGHRHVNEATAGQPICYIKYIREKLLLYSTSTLTTYPHTTHTHYDTHILRVGKVITVGFYIYMFVDQKKCNRTLAIGLPFQTFALGLLVKFIDWLYHYALQKRFPYQVNQGFYYIMHTLLHLSEG